MKWIREHDVVLRVLALLIAVLTWFYVIRTQNPDSSDTYGGVSLQFEGIQQLSDNGLVITSGADTTVTVKLTGKRDRILLVSKDKITASVNVSSITAPGEYALNYTVSNEVEGVSPSSKSPAQITIVVDRLSSRTVPVKLTYAGTLADGYQLSSSSLNPDAIGISGPQAALDKVSYAAVSFDLTGKTDSGVSTLSYTLMTADGTPAEVSRITTDVPSTELTYTITRSGAVPLRVDFQDTDGLTQDMIEYTITPESINVSGSADAIGTVNHIDLGTISLRSVMENNLTTVEMPIVLPNGVTAAEGAPTTATVTIRTPGYAHTVFQLTQDHFPAAAGLTYPAQTLELNLFGPKDELDAITAADFTLQLDYDAAALKAGENTLNVLVAVKQGDVRVLGKYTVTADYAGGS